MYRDRGIGTRKMEMNMDKDWNRDRVTVPDVQDQRDIDKEDGVRDKGRKRDKETGTGTEGHGEGHKQGQGQGYREIDRVKGQRDRDRVTRTK